MKKDLTGQRFGRLYVVSKVEPSMVGKSIGRSVWLCQCDCGNKTTVRTDHLTRGQVSSCGCYKKIAHTKHGLSNTRLYKCWNGIKQRCENPNNAHYKNYGFRGISICDEWKDFGSFYKWAIKNGYKEGLTIDRKDVNGNYEPENCRWATRKEQARNVRKTIYAEINGKRQDLSSWAEELGVSRELLYRRVHKLHWTPEEAVLGKHNKRH